MQGKPGCRQPSTAPSSTAGVRSSERPACLFCATWQTASSTEGSSPSNLNLSEELGSTRAVRRFRVLSAHAAPVTGFCVAARNRRIRSTVATPNIAGGKAQRLARGSGIAGDWWTKRKGSKTVIEVIAKHQRNLSIHCSAILREKEIVSEPVLLSAGFPLLRADALKIRLRRQ